jgi:murein DD-endopeptidase MepM/ murein hydrolase activator NlpD
LDKEAMEQGGPASITRRRLGVLGVTGLAAVATGTILAPAAEAKSPYSLGSKTLSKGNKGTYVKRLQKALNTEDKAGLDVDGSFGPGTDQAVRAYQRSRSLTVDGRVGPGTKKALNAHEKGTGFFLPMHRSIHVTSEFNPKRRNPVTGKITPHEGIDLAASIGTELYAAAAGTVTAVGYDPTEDGKSGNRITIKHANGYYTKYSHMKNQTWKVKKGQKVERGQLIGYSGDTGRVTGPHLHFGVKKSGTWINPRKVLSF